MGHETMGAVATSRAVESESGRHASAVRDRRYRLPGDTYGQSCVMADVHLDWVRRQRGDAYFAQPAGSSWRRARRQSPDRRHGGRGHEIRSRPIQARWRGGPRQRHRAREVLGSRGCASTPPPATGRAGVPRGDAAHVHSTAGGQGINTAYRTRRAGAGSPPCFETGRRRILDGYEARAGRSPPTSRFNNRMTRVPRSTSCIRRFAMHARVRTESRRANARSI